MNPLRLSVFGLFVGAVCFGAVAQQSATGTGTVTGHVTCGDTQLPAKFANVVLLEVPAQVTVAPKLDPNGDGEAALAAMTSAMQSIGQTNMVQTQTALDGSYIATDVAPGEYYLFATQSGYVSPLNHIQALIAGGADLKKPLPGIPVVHVVADHSAGGDVTMERGAAISGTISWDDGSPVTGAIMAVAPATGEAARPPSQFGMLAMVNVFGAFSVSDDQGHYRIASLSPGDYVVQATVQSGTQSGIGKGMNLNRLMAASPLVVFSPSAFRKAEAKPLTVHAGEDLRDQQMTLKMSGLHSVSGRVGSGDDHHGINQATVRLTDTQDKTFSRAASVDAVGNFTVTYVPAGTYSMKVSDAEDTEPGKAEPGKKSPGLFGTPSKTLRSYEDGTMQVVVTDSNLTDQNIDLKPDTSGKPKPTLGGVFDGILSGVPPPPPPPPAPPKP